MPFNESNLSAEEKHALQFHLQWAEQTLLNSIMVRNFQNSDQSPDRSAAQTAIAEADQIARQILDDIVASAGDDKSFGKKMVHFSKRVITECYEQINRKRP